MTIKAIWFDYMGTCLDWHTSILSAFPSEIDHTKQSEIALQWRRQYFIEREIRTAKGLPMEDVNDTFARALDVTLQRYAEEALLFSDVIRDRAIQRWHSMQAWPDVAPALQSLRQQGYELYVHANGTTRLQLNLTRSAGLQWDMLFSSELLGVYKPDPEAYLKALHLLKLKSEECILVAAHAYDLRGAKAVGIKTIYVHRWTDDIDEGMEEVRGENDAFLDDMSTLADTIGKLQ